MFTTHTASFKFTGVYDILVKCALLCCKHHMYQLTPALLVIWVHTMTGKRLQQLC